MRWALSSGRTTSYGLSSGAVCLKSKQAVVDFARRLGIHPGFPHNFSKAKVESVVLNDLANSSSPLIVTGFISLDCVIDFADLPADRPQTPRLLIGSEPTLSRRSQYSISKKTLPQEVIDYWLNAGISLRSATKSSWSWTCSRPDACKVDKPLRNPCWSDGVDRGLPAMILKDERRDGTFFWSIPKGGSHAEYR